MENERLTAALDYAARGWYVVPLNPQSKALSWDMCHKLNFLWNLDQPAPTEQDIRRWFKVEPDINIGIRMAGSGLAVFDVDAPAHVHKIPGADGPPLTPTVQTGKGVHYYFRAPEGAVSGQVRVFQPPEPSVLVGDFLTPTPPEWKEDMAYVVAPPSRHPDMFSSYQWIMTPNVPLAEVPDWLLAAVVPPLPPSSWFVDMDEDDEEYHEAMAAEWDDED